MRQLVIADSGLSDMLNLAPPQSHQKHARDGLIVADSAEPRLITELKRHCNVKPSIKGQGSVTYGISLLQDYDLVVSPDSTNLIKELNNYRWLERKSNTPIDKYGFINFLIVVFSLYNTIVININMSIKPIIYSPLNLGIRRAFIKSHYYI